MIFEMNNMERTVNITKNQKFEYLGSENISLIDKVCAFLLVIAPILQFHIGLYKSAGFTMLLIAFPFLLFRFLVKISINGKICKQCIIAILPLVLFEIYSIVSRDLSLYRIIYVLFVIFYYLFISFGCVNLQYFIKYAKFMGYLASILLCVQYIFYYIFRFALNLEATRFILPENERWIKGAVSGRVTSFAKLYRPSAFFLEPSHFFLFVFPLLCVCLFSLLKGEKDIKGARLLTLGLILSTSGMGIVFTIMLWVVYYVKEIYYNSKSNDTQVRKKFIGSILAISFLLVVIVLAYMFVPFFQGSINRIFLNTSGSSAIGGRINRASKYIKSISGSAILFGTPGISSNLDFNLAGFFSTYIRWGILGLLLTYWFYGRGLFKLKGASFWVSVIILIISFFTAHTHGTFYMIYYSVYLINGYYGLDENHNIKTSKNKLIYTNYKH